MFRSRTDQHQVNFRWMEIRRRAKSAGARLVCLFLSFAPKFHPGSQVQRRMCTRIIYYYYCYFLSLRVSSARQAGSKLCLCLREVNIRTRDALIPVSRILTDTMVECSTLNHITCRYHDIDTSCMCMYITVLLHCDCRPIF